MRVTIFSTGGKFHPVSIFTQLHALTLVSCSYNVCVLGHDGSESVSELVYRHVSIYKLILS